MQWKKLFRKLLFPGGGIVLLCTAAAAGGLAYVFTGNRQAEWIAYPIYVFSAYGLTIFCAMTWGVLRHSKEIADEIMTAVPPLRRYFTDTTFKMHVSLYQSLGLNVLYAAMKLGFGIFYRSVWFGTLAVYYFLLAVVRFSLILYARRYEFGADLLAEWKRYRLCGVILLLLDLVLSGEVVLIVYQNESFRYAGYLIYIMALYAFYCVITAVRDVARYRAFRSPVMSAAKALQLAKALVSMLALETAMLEQFGEADGEHFRALMTGCTGAGVFLMILGMAVYMIHTSGKEIKRLKQNIN